MSTEWVVTTAAERIALDEQKRGETTFTVTNPSRRADRAVFEVVPSDGADRNWFSVEEPQRLVRGNASVAYLLKVAVAPAAPAGAYAVQARVYSADSAPEESSVLSGRVMLEVKAAPPPEKKKFPWWWLVVAALVVIVLVVVGIVVFSGDDAPATVAVPDVTKKTQAEATTALNAAGLNIGKVTHQHSADLKDVKDQVLTQSAGTATQVDRGSTVDLTVAVNLSAPAPTEPTAGQRFPVGTIPTLKWTQAEPWVTSWTLVLNQQVCYQQFLSAPVTCRFWTSDTRTVNTPEFKPVNMLFFYRTNSLYTGHYYTGVVQWTITPMDETGQPGTPSAVIGYQVGQ